MSSSTKNKRKKTVMKEPISEENLKKAEGESHLLPIVSQIGAIVKPDPRTVPRPDEDDFFVTDEVWTLAVSAILHEMALLVVGPSGCGKSELVARAVLATRRSLEVFNMGATSEPRSALIGVTHYDPIKGTIFNESRFIKALRRPYTSLLLDEVNRMTKEAANMLIPLLDEQKFIALDESENCDEVVHPAEGVTFVATANIGCEYTATNEFDWALKNRFAVVIRLDFMDLPHELGVLLKRCPRIDLDDATRLARVAQRQRALWKEGEYATAISTRSLIAAGKLCGEGIPVDLAFKFCVQNHFRSEGGLISDCEKLAEIWKFSGDVKKS